MLYVLIPVHNNVENTMKCLDCISEQIYIDYEVVIVNDGSTDESSEVVKEKYPDIIVLEGDGNLWWAGALYKGIEYVLEKAFNTDYILILNNDLIFNKHYFTNLVNGADINPDTALGSLCRNQKTGKIVDSGVVIDWMRLKFTHKEVKDNGDFIRNIDVLSTRGLIVPVYIIKHVGNFIPHRIKHYLSDYEYTIRIKNAGYRLLTVKSAVVLLDTEQTGIHTDWNDNITVKSLFDTIFSTKSSSNLKSWLWFIHLSCPSNHKLSCYWKITFGKVLEIIRSKIC